MLVGKLVVKFAGTILQDIVDYHIFKIFEDFFLSQEKQDNMLLEVILSENLSNIRSGGADKKKIRAENRNSPIEI